MRSQLEERYISAKRALFDKVYGNLNPEQRRAVFQTKGPLLILAGAGSGKTTVLVRRIEYIIRYGNAYHDTSIPYELTEEAVVALEKALRLSVPELQEILLEFIKDACPPYQMLAITFTNKAANEIKSRLVDCFGDETVAKDIWSGTFHSVCMRILRTYADRLGFEKYFTIYDTDDTKKAVSAVMKKLGIDEKTLPVKMVMGEISRAKDRLMDPDDYADEAGVDYRLSRVARVYAAYQDELHRSGAMDFDDIIFYTVRLLRENEDILRYYQRKFRYVCIDEYQDTNKAQFELAALLSGGTRNLMVVGDDDQSIYKFRGATIENILGFDQVFEQATVIKLEQNYRSTQNILNAANGIIGHNHGRKGKKLWTAGSEGEKIVVRKVEDQMSEARSVIDTIAHMMRSGERERTYRDFAVLYRTNAQSSGLERALAKSGIPYRMVGGTRFNDRKEIRDAVAYLQLISNHSDRERLLRIINEPRRGIGDKTLAAVDAIAAEQGCSLFDVMDKATAYPALSRSAKALTAFADLIKELGGIAENASLGELFDAVMEKTGYMEALRLAGEAEKDRIDNLYELKSNMMEYTQNSEAPTLVGFLEENALVADVDKYDDKADAVVLMTVHSAKGLEFPVVFLPGMEDGIFPGMQNIMGSSEDMEEERRLAYVAVTRAKERVIILHAKSRLWYGQTVANRRSRFVDEIPDDLILEEDLTADAAYGASYARPEAPRTYIYDRPQRHKAPVHTDRTTVGQVARPLMPNPSGTAEALKPGDRVRHMTFGEGEILSVKPMGKDQLIEVMFDTVGTKKLMATYAKLKKLH
ncbi:MAG: UvrD-helicase domain-containing protein [Clostridia bacterium]|nr:UvrD-helicase domain-containing protein [Clostridia bacterium]